MLWLGLGRDVDVRQSVASNALLLHAMGCTQDCIPAVTTVQRVPHVPSTYYN